MKERKSVGKKKKEAASKDDKNKSNADLIPYADRELQGANNLITGAIFKSKVDDTIESMETRIKIVKEMVTGERPADSKMADIYLREVLTNLEKVREITHKFLFKSEFDGNLIIPECTMYTIGIEFVPPDHVWKCSI